MSWQGFRDRQEAGEKLAKALAHYSGKNPLVLGIPRGAVPMAKVVAEALAGQLDVVLVRKLRAPFEPELAIGSVDESGWVYIADHVAAAGCTAAYIEQEKNHQLATIRKRRAQYTPVRASISPAGRTVIVIDDGLATGATMIAALHGLRAQQPAKLICAVPVSPAPTWDRIAPLADEVICLLTPEFFGAIGQFYGEFPQVEDEEVIKLLKE